MYIYIYSEMEQAASFFGGNVVGLSPHSFRRGGATWLFQLLGSYDLVMTRGRWAQLGTTKVYIDTAMSDVGRHVLTKDNTAKVQLCNELLPVAMRKVVFSVQ